MVFGMSGNGACFCRKCLCVALGSATQACPASDCPPHPARCPLVWLQFGSSHKAFGGSPPARPHFTHRSKESFLFRNQEFGLTGCCSQVRSCQQTGLAVPASVPSQCLLLCPPDLTPEAPSPAGHRQAHPLLFYRLRCSVCTLAPCLGSGYTNSLKAETVILTSLPWGVQRNRQSDTYSRWGGGGENQPAE